MQDNNGQYPDSHRHILKGLLTRGLEADDS